MSASSSTPSAPEKDPRDLVTRGSYRPTPIGRTVFLILRGIDPIIQYFILSRHAGISWIPKYLGGALLPTSIGLRPTTAAFFDLPPHQTLLLGMSVGSMLKQNFWLTALSRDEMHPKSAFIIAVFNTLRNGVTTALASWTLTSVNPSASTWSELFRNPSVTAGTALYAIGILLETVSEIQRSRFKADERNKGKPYSGGLFGLARHINYTGYTCWAAGFGLAAAGPALGAVLAAWSLYDFSQRAIPVLDEYCSKRVSFPPPLFFGTFLGTFLFFRLRFRGMEMLI